MAKYKDAVAWIAYNDEDSLRTPDDLPTIEGMLTVLLVADLWGKPQREVARAVLRERQKEDARK